MGPTATLYATDWKLVGTTQSGQPLYSPHGKCREKQNCTGPGCRVETGKTARKRGKVSP